MMYDSIIIDCENIIVTDNKTFQLEGKESIPGNVEPGAWRHWLCFVSEELMMLPAEQPELSIRPLS